MSNWIFFDGQNTVGPFPLQDLKVAARRGSILKETWVACEGGPFQRAGTVADLKGLVSPGGDPSVPQPTPPWQVTKSATVRVVKGGGSSGLKSPVVLVGAGVGLLVVILLFAVMGGGTPPPAITIPTLSPNGPAIDIAVPKVGAEKYNVLLTTKEGVSIPLPDESWVNAGMPRPSGFALDTWIPTEKGIWAAAWKNEDPLPSIEAIVGGTKTNTPKPKHSSYGAAILKGLALWGVPDYIAVGIQKGDGAPPTPIDYIVRLAMIWNVFDTNKQTLVPVFEVRMYKGKLVRGTFRLATLFKPEVEKELAGAAKDISSLRPALGTENIQISQP